MPNMREKNELKMSIAPDLYGITLSANLDDVVRTLNRWNNEHKLGLMFHTPANDLRAAAWSIGNCLITACAVTPGITEFVLRRRGIIPPDQEAWASWAIIYEGFGSMGLIKTVEQIGYDVIATNTLYNKVTIPQLSQAKQAGSQEWDDWLFTTNLTHEQADAMLQEYEKLVGMTPEQMTEEFYASLETQSANDAIGVHPMSPLSDYKRQALEKRHAALIEEYEAANAQLSRALSDVDRVRLQRQVDDLERQIQEIEAELGASSAPKALADEHKASAGAAPSAATTLYGAGNRWAVLVGVNIYEDAMNYGRLQVCVKDVEATREQLIAGGFDAARIRLLTDNTRELPTRANILAALQSVANATQPDDLLLFYYSGHGDKDESESYLVARDGRQVILSDSAVPVMRVKAIMEKAKARAKVILLDACHSGADFGGKGPQKMSPEFIQRVFEQAKGLAILASCEQGQLSYEWRKQERSVFTHYLLEALQGNADRDDKHFVTVQDVNRHVTDGVSVWASQNDVSQTPTLQYTVAGDIILARYE